jgi:hydrogenase/urease accessory protein HupE
MSMSSRVVRPALTFAVAASLLLPAAAAAHALFADHNPNRPVLEYVWIGFWHMVGGWDHLLFILGVVLIAGALKPAAKMISLFVLGHSLTLIVATVAGWKLNATVVDVVIALSLVYVGIQGLVGRPDDFRLMGAIVFAFGLVHGLGLSTRLQDLGLPESGVVIRVILFNVGVEVGSSPRWRSSWGSARWPCASCGSRGRTPTSPTAASSWPGSSAPC